jgi:hypothetical protein
VLCEENVDNCDPDPCHHGQCQDGIDSYTCLCNPGYMGAICSDQIDECYSSPCLNEGRCIDLVNGYQCNCQPGTSGETPGFPCSQHNLHRCLHVLDICADASEMVLILRAPPEPQPQTSPRSRHYFASSDDCVCVFFIKWNHSTSKDKIIFK